jgi:hypothetical protein
VQATSGAFIIKALNRAKDSGRISRTCILGSEGGAVLAEGTELTNVYALVVALRVLLEGLHAGLPESMGDWVAWKLGAPELLQAREVGTIVGLLQQLPGKSCVVIHVQKT